MGLIIGYTIVVAILAAFVVCVILVNKNVILKNSSISRFFSNPLLYYSMKRIGSAVISFLLAITVTFCLLRIQDKMFFCGGWVNKYPIDMRPIVCDAKLDQLGLNDPLIVQLFKYLFDVLPFPKQICMRDTYKPELAQFVCLNGQMEWKLIYFGKSNIINPQGDIWRIISQSVPYSFKMGIFGVMIQMALGYPLGVFMAKHKNGLVDRVGNGYIIFVSSIPGLVFYYLFFAVFVNFLGMPRMYDPANPVLTLLPAILTLGLGGLTGIALWVRRYMVDEFNSDYVKFARSKGLSENRILFTHVLRNAVVPLVRTFPSAILSTLLGSFFIEKIYGIPGFGGLLVDSIMKKDYPVVQAVVIISALISIIASLAGDILTAMVDPRVSFSSKK